MNKYGNNQHKKKVPYIKYGVGIGLFLAFAGMLAFHGNNLFADTYDAVEDVVVTASVKLDCTSETHMYTDECIGRITTELKNATVDLAKAENVLEEIRAENLERETAQVTIVNTKTERFNQAVFQVTTVLSKFADE